MFKRRRTTASIALCLFAATVAQAAVASAAPTIDEATAFVEKTERRLLELWIKTERAAWVQANFITMDTDRIWADARKEMASKLRTRFPDALAIDLRG